jgi:hypothetical protein
VIQPPGLVWGAQDAVEGWFLHPYLYAIYIAVLSFIVVFRAQVRPEVGPPLQAVSRPPPGTRSAAGVAGQGGGCPSLTVASVRPPFTAL